MCYNSTKCVFDSLIGSSTFSSSYIYYEFLLVSLPNPKWKQQTFGIAYTLVCLLHTHDMPTFKSEVFHLVSKLQLVKLLFLYLKGIHDTLCYLPGADAEQSYSNFLTAYTKYTKRKICHVQAQLKEQKLTVE